jgi:hypothetical protein
MSLVAQSLNLAEVRSTPENRRAQVNQAITLQKEDPTQSDIAR